jgi:hypothetical protein
VSMVAEPAVAVPGAPAARSFLTGSAE